jgi:hypothetical protein
MGKAAVFILLVAICGVGYFFYSNPHVLESVQHSESGGGGIAPPPSNSTNLTNFTTITVCNWNIQVFGPSKAGNNDLMDELAGVLAQCDIAVVQEIRDASQTAFPALCGRLQGYNCEVSERKGRTSSKEQYGLLYKLSAVTNVTEVTNYDKWERPPTVFYMEEFAILTLHSKPSDVESEINYLQEYADTLEGPVVLLGDFNMAGSYYDLPTHHFENWTMVIPDYQDTTVAASSNAYDRIFLKDLNFTAYGVDTSVTSDMSDHYLIWTELKI